MTMFRNEQFTTAVQVARTVALAARVETVGDEVFAAIAPLAAGLLSDAALIAEAERRGISEAAVEGERFALRSGIETALHDVDEDRRSGMPDTSTLAMICADLRALLSKAGAR